MPSIGCECNAAFSTVPGIQNALRRFERSEVNIRMESKQVIKTYIQGGGDWIWWLKMVHDNNVVNDIQVHQTQAVQSAQYDTYQHQNRISGHTNSSNCYKLNSIEVKHLGYLTSEDKLQT